MAKKDDEMREDGLGEGGGGSRVYELGFHIDPELPSEEVKKTYADLRDLVGAKGALVAEGEPVMVQLAYALSRQEASGRRDFTSAHFAWLAYETSAANHADVLAAAKDDARIIRFIDLVTTKDAARHSAELRELSLKAQEKAPERADTELDAALENVAV